MLSYIYCGQCGKLLAWQHVSFSRRVLYEKRLGSTEEAMV